MKLAIEEAAEYINNKIAGAPLDIALVLGSGLGSLAEEIEESTYIPFTDVPHMKMSTATSHVGRFVCGRLADKNVICMQGRLHGYEGNSAEEVAFPIWVMQNLGAKILITTNAAGAINESYNVGDFCIIRDHINFTGRNPVAGQEPNTLASRFFSMFEAYDPELRKIAREVALKHSISTQEGVYLGLLGPSFETPAEIQMFRRWGADTVAMSVCEEVIAARHVGMRVLGISLCSNMACGIAQSNPSDEEVLDIASNRSKDFSLLIKETLRRI